MRRRIAVVAVGIGGLAVLHLVGSGELAMPPAGSTDELRRWISATDPVVAAFAVLRLVAMAAGWYLTAIGVLGIAATRARRPRLARLVEAITLPALRPLVGSAGLGALVVVSAVGAAPVGADPGLQPTDVLVEITADSQPPVDPTTTSTSTTTPPTSTTTSTTAPRPSDTPPPTMRALDDDPVNEIVPTTETSAPPLESPKEPAPVTMHRLDTASTPISAPAPSASPEQPADSDATWTIEPGDSFWSVASAHLTDLAGRAPDGAELDAYWRALMAANPDASPTGDPDLLYAGTVLILPPV
jgi:hypothetical protein